MSGRRTPSSRARAARLLRPARGRGLGTLEWLVVVAVIGIVAAAALPSWMGHLERRAVEGAATQLLGDLQYARSEAVQRNEAVAVTAGANCHVIHLASASAACSSAGAAVSPEAAALKSVVLEGRPAVTASAEGGLARVVFDPVGATATFVGVAAGTDSASWLVSSANGSLGIRVSVNPAGRATACVPAGDHVPGIPDCVP